MDVDTVLRNGRKRRRGHHRLPDLSPARSLLRVGNARLSAGDALRLPMAGLPGADPAHEARRGARLHAVRGSAHLVVLALGLMVAALSISLWVENSRFGMALTAIKQNEPAAEAAGIDTWRWKMLALMLSGAIAAVAGGLYAVVLLVLTPDTVFGMLVSAQALILALFGGVGSLWGPVLGAMVLVPLAEGLNAELGDVLPGIQGVVYGIAIIAIILLAPEGVYWRVLDRFAKRAPAVEPVAPEPVLATNVAPL